MYRRLDRNLGDFETPFYVRNISTIIVKIQGVVEEMLRTSKR